MADQLQKTPQAIYQQLRKLLKADLVEVSREERIDHFIEKYYRSSAEYFEFAHGESKSPYYAEERTRDALMEIGELGIKLRVDDATVEKIVRTANSTSELGLRPEQEEKIADNKKLDYIGKQVLAHYANLLMMSDKQFEEYLNVERVHRDLLKSSLIEPLRLVANNPRKRKRIRKRDSKERAL